MKVAVYFLAGVVGGFIGFVVWVVFSFLQAGETIATGGEDPAITAGMAAGFALMLGSPLLFWVLIPFFLVLRAVWRWMTGGR